MTKPQPICPVCRRPMNCPHCEHNTREKTAAELRAAREAAGITLREMARRCDVTPGSITGVETGKFPGHELRRKMWAELDAEYGKLGNAKKAKGAR